MDNNWRSTAQVGEAPMDTGNWRTQLQYDSRERIVNKIMETMKRHLPFSGQEGLQELKKIAVRFEENIYIAATSQADYLRKISLKLLAMENKSQNTIPNPLPANLAANSNKLADPAASHSMHTEVHNQGQSLSIPSLTGNQSQAHQQLLSQNLQNNIATAGVLGSTGLASALPSVSGILQTPMASVSQNNSMQNMSSMSQTVGNVMGQTVPSNVFTNAQRQMPGRQPVFRQQQQQQSQNSQYLYQQQLPQQLLNPNFQLPLMSSHIQQHQQQQQQQNNLLQPNQLQSSQLANVQSSSVKQPSMIQSTGLQQNQPSSVQQSMSSMLQHQQSVPRQQQQQLATFIHQPQSQLMKQQLLPSQQQQFLGQQPNASSIQQNNIGEMQQQRLLGRQNSLQNLQQQQLQQQQLMAQQNNISTMHLQQLGPQNTVVLQQQQQLLGSQSGNSCLPANQHTVQMLQSKVPMQQQPQQTGTSLLVTPGQQSQSQQLQMQSPPTQLQQLVGLQQQPNPTQRDLQQRLQVSIQGAGSLLQSQSLINQQKQLYQSQRALPDISSTSLDTAAQIGQINGGDWQEEVYQKVKLMKETYLPELTEVYQKVAAKLQQHDSLPQQPKSDQLNKLKIFKSMVERMISVVQMTKSNITPGFKEKLPSYEKQILSFLTINRRRKPVSSMQQGLLQPHMQSMQQSQSQVPHLQSHGNHMSTPLQSMNLQGSASTMPHNSMSSLQHNSLPSISGVSTSQQNIMNQLQSGSNMDAG